MVRTRHVRVFGDTTPCKVLCKVTPVILKGVVSLEGCTVALQGRVRDDKSLIHDKARNRHLGFAFEHKSGAFGGKR